METKISALGSISNQVIPVYSIYHNCFKICFNVICLSTLASLKRTIPFMFQTRISFHFSSLSCFETFSNHLWLLASFSETSVQHLHTHYFHASTVHFFWSLYIIHANKFPITAAFPHSSFTFRGRFRKMDRGFAVICSEVYDHPLLVLVPSSQIQTFSVPCSKSLSV
jgi:hypothetical protein